MRTIGLKRDTTDKFYTNINVAQECIDRLLLQVSQDDVFLEPAAGNGSFCCLLWDRGIECIALDIDPQYSNIQQGDFLKYEIETDRRPIHAIGNPPFGRQSCVAIQFIRRACLFCDTVAFILPASFKKPSLQSKIIRAFHLVDQWDVPVNSFQIESRAHHVPCVFQIWMKRDGLRDVPKSLVPIGFTFVKKNQHPDVSVRRVGVNAGRIDREIETKNIESHYFIKMDWPLIDEQLEELQEITYETDNTVGPRSISKQEIIQRWNQKMC